MWDLKLWWVKPVAVLAVCAALLSTGGLVGYRLATAKWQKAAMDAELSHQKYLVQQAEATRKALEEAESKRIEAQKEINRLAALPPKVIERVRTNPSNCDLSRPVADGLREQINETNAALRRAAGRS